MKKFGIPLSLAAIVVAVQLSGCSLSGSGTLVMSFRLPPLPVAMTQGSKAINPNTTRISVAISGPDMAKVELSDSNPKTAPDGSKYFSFSCVVPFGEKTIEARTYDGVSTLLGAGATTFLFGAGTRSIELPVVPEGATPVDHAFSLVAMNATLEYFTVTADEPGVYGFSSSGWAEVYDASGRLVSRATNGGMASIRMDGPGIFYAGVFISEYGQMTAHRPVEYVWGSASGPDYGTRTDPFKTIEEAMRYATREIRVAMGTYRQTATLEMKRGVSLVGGFPSDFSQAEPEPMNYLTEIVDDRKDAAAHILVRFGPGIGRETTLRGFSIWGATGCAGDYAQTAVAVRGSSPRICDNTIIGGNSDSGAIQGFSYGLSLAAGGSLDEACAPLVYRNVICGYGTATTKTSCGIYGETTSAIIAFNAIESGIADPVSGSADSVRFFSTDGPDSKLHHRPVLANNRLACGTAYASHCVYEYQFQDGSVLYNNIFGGVGSATTRYGYRSERSTPPYAIRNNAFAPSAGWTALYGADYAAKDLQSPVTSYLDKAGTLGDWSNVMAVATDPAIKTLGMDISSLLRANGIPLVDNAGVSLECCIIWPIGPRR